MTPSTVISHKEAATTFLQLVASGKVREAYQNYIGRISGITIHLSEGMLIR